MASAKVEGWANIRTTWRADLLSSVVVFLVAVPLCIGIAQACGLPPMTGIMTGIVGGLLIGFISGSPLQVSGPAAGLIVLVIEFFERASAAGYSGTAGLAALGVVIVLAGLLQVVAGVLRLGQWFRAVSPAVVGGMLAGIGITIIAKQFHVMVDDAPPKGVIEGLLTIPAAIGKGFEPPPGSSSYHTQAFLIGVMTILVLVSWKAVVPKKLKLIPAAVAAVILAIVVVEANGFGIDRVVIGENVFEAFQPIPWPGWDLFGSSLVWVAAITFALIASAETLLCATAVDTMHNGPRTKYDRELMAQGVGNMICGTVGALPMTGVIVRSSANVEAGARTRLSTILHGFWILLFVALLPDLLSKIPVAALAAVLVYTGWKLIGIPSVIKLWRESRSEAFIYVFTAGTIIATDLLTGVIAGVVISAVKLLWASSRLEIRRDEDISGKRIHIFLEGAATFLRLPQLAAALESLPHGYEVHIHLDRLRLIDHAVLQLFVGFQKQYESTGGSLFIDWDKLHANFRNGGTSPDDGPSNDRSQKEKAGLARLPKKQAQNA